mgnify:CR=1 FL=1
MTRASAAAISASAAERSASASPWSAATASAAVDERVPAGRSCSDDRPATPPAQTGAPTPSEGSGEAPERRRSASGWTLFATVGPMQGLRITRTPEGPLGVAAPTLRFPPTASPPAGGRRMDRVGRHARAAPAGRSLRSCGAQPRPPEMPLCGVSPSAPAWPIPRRGSSLSRGATPGRSSPPSAMRCRRADATPDARRRGAGATLARAPAVATLRLDARLA